MPAQKPSVFKGSFQSFREGTQEDPRRRGVRPVVFDILGPDRETTILPDDLRLVLHVNPDSMKITYAKQIDRVQTKGGFVEFHWGDAAEDIQFEMATGGFMRLFTGLSNRTGSTRSDTSSVGRRETIAYDKYLDLLALFHNNGAIYDARGQIAAQGYIRVTFDGGTYIGWFQGFTVNETAEKPYQFALSTSFQIDYEQQSWRSTILQQDFDLLSPVSGEPSGGTPPVIQGFGTGPIGTGLDALAQRRADRRALRGGEA